MNNNFKNNNELNNDSKLLFDENGINLERYTNPIYEFHIMPSISGVNITPIRKNDEPDWTINPELKESVFQDMPSTFTLEEKVMYIYCKLCKNLTYDDGYYYKDNLDSNEYTPEFSKEKLEKIIPNSKVTCWDFSRILSKLINSLDGDIEALILAEGMNKGHFLVGFYTNKVSALLEGVQGRSGATNDLMKAKNGIEFEGIEIISDKDLLLDKAIKKVYPMVFGKKQEKIENYINQLQNIPKENSTIDIEKKLESFIEILKQSNLHGDDALQTFYGFHHFGFFGEKLDKAFVGKKEEKNNKKSYRRIVLLKQKNNVFDSNKSNTIYIFDPEHLNISKSNSKEILGKLSTGEYVYESQKHMIPGIETEVK